MKSLDKVSGFLLDMDGTFYLGDALLPGATHFLDVLAAQGKEYLFLTNNSSQNRLSYARKFTRLGLSIPEYKILTSGEAAVRYLKNTSRATRICVVGTPDLENEFQEAGYILDAKTPELVVLGFDTTLSYAKLVKLCDFVRAGLPYIATHPDFNCPTESGLVPDIGATIAFVKAATGRDPDQVIGKPNRWIVESAAQKLGLALEDLAMVGDRLYTDIALGQTSGILTVLVLSGETSSVEAAISAYHPDAIFEDIGALADWLEEHA